MEKRNAWLVVVLVLMCHALAAAAVGGYEGGQGEQGRGGEERGGGGAGGGGQRGEEWFLLQKWRQVVKTLAGNMMVVRGNYGGWNMGERPMDIGFITMEPKSLFIPQYLDAHLVLFVRRGEARIGSIYKDELVENQLKTGDVYTVEAGSAFYLVNTGETQKLQIICSIDTSQTLGWRPVQSFFIGGGTYPTSVFAGFDPQTLSAAFNVSIPELRDFFTQQRGGPIVHLSNSTSRSIWSRFLELEQHQRLSHLRKMVQGEESREREEEKRPKWSLRKLLISLLGGDENVKTSDKKSLKPFNIYRSNPGFSNNYGSSKAVDKSNYAPLAVPDISVYLVNLSAGSMMAPHINPRAAEYGVVLRGTGSVQIVYPNGTLAMNAKLGEGQVFRIPRFFPFCHIASRTGPFEFFGFTTTAKKNMPQFLVGRDSILQVMKGPEFAAGFGLTEDRFNRLINAQGESVIFPSPAAAPPDEDEEEVVGRVEMIPELIKSFGNDMIMGF